MNPLDLIAPLEKSTLSQKYGVASYSEYKAWASSVTNSAEAPIQRFPPDRSYTPIQTIAFAVEIMENTIVSRVKYIVINEGLVRRFIKIGEPIPTEFEDRPIIVDLQSPFEVAFIL